jgi:phosphoglycolate phosphatase-like HAD superfamily hydrolase
MLVEGFTSRGDIAMAAILFGSISSVADTSELQRDAFNRAFEAHDLGWHWDRDQYRAMLATSGGKDRVAAYARSAGQTADAQSVHDTKSRLFQQSLTTAPLRPRPGVVDTIKTARSHGWKVDAARKQPCAPRSWNPSAWSSPNWR